jgi:hypothetical protein
MSERVFVVVDTRDGMMRWIKKTRDEAVSVMIAFAVYHKRDAGEFLIKQMTMEPSGTLSELRNGD